MPRPGPRRPYIAVRLDPDMVEWIDNNTDLGANRSEKIRAMLATARRTLGGNPK